ncbi:RAMP superfamily CRISPR-associated protein [Anabaena sp. CCY 9402-a]|uniref:RAMP superfamily CRISPR-associated protein n=1 Tax=Anabaena sp. CCY 9402-a TaxID=3103867 RepID=UPI0039C6EAE9
MKTITFSLHTQQPLLATSFQGDPNSDVSYNYIPGSMIRGAIIGRYMKEHNLSELDLNNNVVKRLFFDKKTYYLNAYLLSQKQKRTLPVPLSWFKDKDAELSDDSSHITVYDFSIDEEEKPETPKFVAEYFWTEEGGVTFYKEKRRINIHNRRDRKKGRASQEEGEIFCYDAMDAGQAFQAVILCHEADADFLKNLLQKSADIWLGGSQSAGYGHTKISDVICHDVWNEISIPATKRINNECLKITLLSDLILRDEWGQYAVIPPSTDHQTPAPLIKELEKVVGTLKPQRSFAGSSVVGGFNRKWGLPLPQIAVLKAGSVFVFDNISLTSEQIQQLENLGIGERRVEGFGRVVVNWLEEQHFQAKKPEPPKLSNQPVLKLQASKNLAAEMAERLLHQKMEQALQKQIGYLKIEGKITNNQLSRLQSVARQALSTGDCDLVLSLLKNLPSNASGQFERATIRDISLKQKLDEWLNNPMSWIGDSQKLKVRVADEERSITDKFARENKLAEKYTLRLIMAVAKKATKEKNND